MFPLCCQLPPLPYPACLHLARTYLPQGNRDQVLVLEVFEFCQHVHPALCCLQLSELLRGDVVLRVFVREFQGTKAVMCQGSCSSRPSHGGADLLFCRSLSPNWFGPSLAAADGVEDEYCWMMRVLSTRTGPAWVPRARRRMRAFQGLPRAVSRDSDRENMQQPAQHNPYVRPTPAEAGCAAQTKVPCPSLLLLTSLPSSQDTQDSAKEPGTNSGASAFRGLLAFKGMLLSCFDFDVASCTEEKGQKAFDQGFNWLLCCSRFTG